MSRENNEYRCGVGDGITLDVYYSRIVFVEWLLGEGNARLTTFLYHIVYIKMVHNVV